MAEKNLAAMQHCSRHRPPSLLPIGRYRETLLYLIETYVVTIVVGQTGSGKTTQIPQFLEQSGWCSEGKIIAVTQIFQPRRVAATTIATRVAEEFGCELGKEVGYSIRFEDVTSSVTKIKFLTDGLLLREVLVDPLLSRYSVIMIDEAHERSLSTDILLGILKKILHRRSNDLRIIISSATMQAEEFLRFFEAEHGADRKIKSNLNDVTPNMIKVEEHSPKEKNRLTIDKNLCQIINLEGRAYPVDILYLEIPTEDFLKKAIWTVIEIHTKEPNGDILVFLTGREEIDNAIEALSKEAESLHSRAQQIIALPLYSGLSSEQQLAIFDEAPENTRKVIFSTNIAEASITIDGIVYVVDTGFVKLRAYNPLTGIDTLTATPISKASALQRAGRAGRTCPGKCFRLYTESEYQALPEVTVPEIQRSNLASMILQLKALGIDNVARFSFITPPPSELIIRGLELLYSLGALDEYAKLTRPVGVRMAEIALEPMMARTILSAPSFKCLSEILTIAAITGVDGSIWSYHEGEKKNAEISRRKFAVEEGDHIMLLNIYQAFITRGKKGAKFCRENFLNFETLLGAVSVRAQLKRYVERFGLMIDEDHSSRSIHMISTDKEPGICERIQRCLTTGFFAHAAKMLPDGTFRTVSGDMKLYAHPNSLMFNRKAEWVIFHEAVETSNKTYIRDITKIEKPWLIEYAPDFYKIN
ncbi:DEAH-box RNA-dependent ATPase-ATP-dependent RNA helicase [Blumeria graminis f. sp. tritici 96224]|uniref:RNA helicase n=1 Tax=Blumeria graminis f. sp. tritici 96224 TaxID=1268274 RepID=A0A061HFN5_BLUGR|nr:DEAH-box RNA-dependent ATPase-ATP-dependent RNA helicase [Blumeria graminis f. sp. tritici 96224]